MCVAQKASPHVRELFSRVMVRKAKGNELVKRSVDGAGVVRMGWRF